MSRLDRNMGKIKVCNKSEMKRERKIERERDRERQGQRTSHDVSVKTKTSPPLRPRLICQAAWLSRVLPSDTRFRSAFFPTAKPCPGLSKVSKHVVMSPLPTILVRATLAPRRFVFDGCFSTVRLGLLFICYYLFILRKQERVRLQQR